MNAVGSFLWHWLRDDPGKWHPILSVYYLTYACDFRCPHCCDGSGQPYPALRSPVLPSDRVMELLAIIRRHCEYLVLTGGEPLQHPDIETILRRLPELRFRGVILTTNGYRLAEALPALAASVTELVVSLQTTDPAKADLAYGRSGAHGRIVENLRKAASYPGRSYKIVISSVATPDNLEDLYEVQRYTREHGFRLAVCPQLVGVKAHPALAGSRAYRELFDFLIAEKRQGAAIQGTVDYIEHMRDLRKFRCRPFTMLVVSPTGDVFYPCLELGRFAGNLLTEPDLHGLRQRGCEQFGPQPDCDTRCHSACALGFARLLDNPLSALHEGYLMTKARLKARRNKATPEATG